MLVVGADIVQDPHCFCRYDGVPSLVHTQANDVTAHFVTRSTSTELCILEHCPHRVHTHILYNYHSARLCGVSRVKLVLLHHRRGQSWPAIEGDVLIIFLVELAGGGYMF